MVTDPVQPVATTGRCATCLFWWSRSLLNGEMRQCTAVRHSVEIRRGVEKAFDDADRDIGSLEYETAETQAYLDAKAICMDAEGYHAHVETAPDFGCVLWKEKTDDQA